MMFAAYVRTLASCTGPQLDVREQSGDHTEHVCGSTDKGTLVDLSGWTVRAGYDQSKSLDVDMWESMRLASLWTKVVL